MNTFEEQILRSLRRISRASDLYSRQLAAQIGLTGPQLVLLRTLESEGTTTASVLANAAALSQGTVTGIVDRLESAGLVRRARDLADRRRISISLTPAGEKVVRRAPSALQSTLRNNLSAMPSSEVQLISSTLERVVTMMSPVQEK